MKFIFFGGVYVEKILLRLVSVRADMHQAV